MRKLLRPTNPYGADAILPGDPQVALELAQALIEGPLMANHARGLWGYSGPERDNRQRMLSIQSTGYGGQSAAAVLNQLAGLGVERAIRIGTCIALDPALELGDVVLATAAVGHGLQPRTGSEPLADAFSRAHGPPAASGTVASVDTLAAATGPAASALAVDGASAGLFSAAADIGIPVTAVLVVVEAGGAEMGDEEARNALVRLGPSAASGLAEATPHDAVHVGRVKQP